MKREILLLVFITFIKKWPPQRNINCPKKQQQQDYLMIWVLKFAFSRIYEERLNVLKEKCPKLDSNTTPTPPPPAPSSIQKVQASSAEEILKFWSRNGMLFSCNGGSRLHANHATLMRSVFPELSYNFQWTVFRSASLVLESLEFSLSPWLFHSPYSRPSLCHPYCMIR